MRNRRGYNRSALILALAVSGTIFADTYPRQPGVDAQHYIFRITVSDDSDEIAGEATADLRFTRDGVTEVALDLASAAKGKGMAVSEVLLDGAAARFKHEADRLTIALSSPPKAGQQRQFTVKYRGVAAGGLWIGKNRYGERVFFSRNWPDLARQWLPMIDHPYDKATSEFLVTAPAKYQVVSNGRLEETIDLGDGRRLTHWKQSVPIASWLNTIGIAQFASRNFGFSKGIPLQTWVYHQDRDAGIVTFERPAREVMEFYSDHIGPYPYQKLANVQAAGGGGGMEHASAIFYGETTVGRGPATNLIAHEIAHQWFGDSVTEKDWDDVWLSEGFATYFTLLNTEHYEGRDAFIDGLKRSREGVFRAEKSNPGVAVRHDNLADMKKVLSQIVYQKGGWTLHMLRGQIGTEKFWAGIRDYYHRYRDSNASTEDFRKVMEENSGADLGWFFEQWLNRPGSPLVEGSWRYDAAAKRIDIELAQTQASQAYRLPLQMGVFVEGVPQMRVEKIEMTQKHQRFQIASEKEPSAVALDPDTWVLMDAKFTRRL
jgi:aminopeptidase N